MPTRIKTSSPCRAQNPRTCIYHGAEIKADEALKRGDYDAAFEALLQRNNNKAYAKKELDYLTRTTPSGAVNLDLARASETEKATYLNDLTKIIYADDKTAANSNAAHEAINILSRYTPQDTIYDVLMFEHGEADAYGAQRFLQNSTKTAALRKLLAAWQDTAYLQGVERNLLVQADGRDWEANMHRAFARELADHGEVMVDAVSPYGWQDHSYRRGGTIYPDESEKSYTVLAVFDTALDDWDEFEDTFSGTSHRTGITGTALLSDGQVHKLRYETDASVLIPAVTRGH